MNRIVEIKAPLAHQEPVDRSAAGRKVLRCGRRWGKTRWAFKAAITGHGPDMGGVPMHRGIMHGLDVFWIARDYKQGDALWFEEIRPRFKGLEPQVSVNEQQRRIEIKGHGRLWIRTAENIESVRGAGDSLIGVIIDEAAYLNLQPALREVVLPALVDNNGWLVLMSTTNAGPDGYEDAEVGKRSPSFFNTLCEEIQAGARSEAWEEFYGTIHDNPVLPPEAVQELIDEYPPDSVELAQEVYAKLVVGGAGVSFPEWRDDVHIARYSPETDHRFRWSGGGDWGYDKPGALYLMATGPERSLVRHEFYFRKLTPYQAGFQFGKQIMRFPRPEWIAVDTPAVSDGGPTILEQLQHGMRDGVGKDPPPFINPPKGSGSRITKKTLLHEVLRYEADADGKVQPWALPKLQVHPDCSNLLRTLPRLPRDPKKPGDVDTTAEDHAYDAVTSWLMARTPHVERERKRKDHPDDHPGWTPEGKRDEGELPDWFRAGVAGSDEPRWSRKI